MIPNVISEAEETALIGHIVDALSDVKYQGFGKAERSKVLRYGYDYTDKLKQIDPIPGWLTNSLYMVAVQIGKSKLMNSVTINEYQPGHGISRHVDSPKFVSPIVILSLGSSAIMKVWIPSQVGTPCEVYLPPRSLECLFGPWPHSIDGRSVTKTRYSIVFRERLLK